MEREHGKPGAPLSETDVLVKVLAYCTGRERKILKMLILEKEKKAAMNETVLIKKEDRTKMDVVMDE